MMSPGRAAALHRSIAVFAMILAVAAVASWFLCRGRNAWASPGWPRFAGVHHGRVLVLSSLWDGGLSSSGWIYDSHGFGHLGHLWPRYTLIGDTYSGTPPFKALLHAASVPIWYAAVPFVLVALRQVRRARAARALASNACPRCGYPLKGLPTSVCPECGWAPVAG